VAKRRSRGEGTIYRRGDGLWSAQVTLPNGKRKTKYAKSQKEAREWLQAQTGQIKAGIWTSTDTVKLRDFIERYLSEVASKQVRVATLNSYSQHARLHIYPALGNVKLAALRPEHLQRLYSDKIDQGLSAGTVRIIHGVLHRVLHQAAEWGVVSRNVASLVHPPHRRVAEPKMLDRGQLALLLDETRGQWLHPFIYLAITAGLRRSELVALKWSDIDWEARTLRVMRIATEDMDGKLVLSEPKTSSSKRLVVLPQTTLDVLKEWQELSRGDMLFAHHDGSTRTPDSVNAAWDRLLARLGLPHVKVHSLRHLHATMLLEAGVSAKVVSERLGHSNIGITMDLYSHVTAPLQQQAADTIGQAMTGLRKQ
jgi:integrase